ncbi:MAG: alkaline phosphatase family protein [Bacteroidetes bacterium]|nr:alkaline phosphatase family protein [Bacteroidota bacterium]
MKKIISLLSLFILCSSCIAQNSAKSNFQEQNDIIETTNPKLVVGIVVDQMRYDYLTRFYNKYGEGGFKRMINEGFNYKNNHFNYVPTYTGPGHASIYTGTTPKYHGIISNNWYDKVTKKTIYCAGDDSVKSIGTQTKDGQMSPKRMQTTTFADENRLFTQMRGKTIGISIKDRGAILSAGHTANAAYWFYGKNEGNWITSSFYMNELPKWVSDFNITEKAESYLKTWNTLYDINTYTESGSDLNTFEGGFEGKKTATFPYDLGVLSKQNSGYDILKATPYGNSLTTDFAIAALDGEQLGQDNFTDILTVSYSSTDYIGHNFGVNSKEVEDAYLRLDKDLERFFIALDAKVGKGNYTVFLTADHGAVNVPMYLKSVKIPSENIYSSTIKQKLYDFMVNTFNASGLIENVSNNQIYLNRDKLKELNLDLENVQKTIVNEIINYEIIDKAYTAVVMSSTEFTNGIEGFIQRGFNQKRSGDVIVVFNPPFVSYGKTGSMHGTAFNYDTHVPLLFFGKGINHGSSFTKTRVVDIAPTISALLGIAFPSGAIDGKPLLEVID